MAEGVFVYLHMRVSVFFVCVYVHAIMPHVGWE